MHPVFIEINNFVIYWYGILVALAVLICGWMFQKLAVKDGFDPEAVTGALFWTVIWGVVGGRLLHVVVQAPYYYRNPIEILMLRDGGLAAEGSILGGLLCLYVYSKMKNLNLVQLLDIIVIPAALGHAIGRIGCFLNGCCHGVQTAQFIGVQFPELPHRVHPTQLYYSAIYIIMFTLLFKMRKKRVKRGVIFSSYLLGFGLVRYFVDTLRGDLTLTYLGLHATQVIAVFIFMLGAICMNRSFSISEETVQ